MNFLPLDALDFQLIHAAEAAIERNFDAVRFNHTVGAAIRARSGLIYAGVNIDGIHGACAEFIAAGAAITAGERVFDCVVAVYGGEAPHKVLPPCGNCRQMLLEVSPDCQVILQVEGEYCKVQIRDLLPFPCS